MAQTSTRIRPYKPGWLHGCSDLSLSPSLPLSIAAVAQVDGKPIMQTVWPQGCSGNYWQWNDLAQQYSDMWSEKDFQSGSTSLSISGQTQQISISSIVNAPFEVCAIPLMMLSLDLLLPASPCPSI